jgi:hypothetical protein
LDKIIAYLPEMSKALVAGWGAGAAEYALAEQMGDVTLGHWAFIIITALFIGAGTWFKRNAPAASTG